METIEEVKEQIRISAQKTFNELAKPIIIKEMKRLKIRKIEFVMGIYFFTFNNNKTISDTEFIESSEVRRLFYDNFMLPFNEQPFYSLINTDISL